MAEEQSTTPSTLNAPAQNESLTDIDLKSGHPRQDILDPKQEISSQPAREFTLFPDLPIEIRLKIWRDAFPAGREIVLGSRIDREKIKPISEWQKKYVKEQFPVTLKVNSESRRETLRFYTIIWPNGCQGLAAYHNPTFGSPSCFSPARDTMSLWRFDLGGFEDGGRRFKATNRDCQTWLEYLDSKFSGGLASVRSLEILCIVFDDDLSVSALKCINPDPDVQHGR